MEKNERPNDAAFNQLEHVEVRGIVDFLNKAGLLSDDAAKSARKLGEIRNSYAHASGKNPQEDAIAAIKHLHAIVEDTVSIFKGFDLQHGVLMIKDVSIQCGVLRGKIDKSK